MLTVDQLDENSQAHTVFLKPFNIILTVTPVFSSVPFLSHLPTKIFYQFLFYFFRTFCSYLSSTIFYQIIWFIRLQFVTCLAVFS